MQFKSSLLILSFLMSCFSNTSIAMLTFADFSEYVDSMVNAMEQEDLDAFVNHTDTWNEKIQDAQVIELVITDEQRQQMLESPILNIKEYEKLKELTPNERAQYSVMLRMGARVPYCMARIIRHVLGIADNQEVSEPDQETYTVHYFLHWLDSLTVDMAEGDFDGLIKDSDEMILLAKIIKTIHIPVMKQMKSDMRANRFDILKDCNDTDKAEFARRDMPELLEAFYSAQANCHDAYMAEIVMPLFDAWRSLLQRCL